MFRERIRKDQYLQNGIEVRPSETHGLGVFATKDIKSHACLEIAPVILFEKTLLEDYIETWESHHQLQAYVFKAYDGRHAVALGNGSIYNHSSSPNVTWKWRECRKYPALEFWSTREISAGEELFVKYRWDSTTLEFLDESEQARLGIYE